MSLPSNVTFPSNILPLSVAAAGDDIQLVDIRGCGSLRQRLCELGLTRGATVRVLKSDPNGSMILAVRKDTRLAIERSIAHKILVSYQSERE